MRYFLEVVNRVGDYFCYLVGVDFAQYSLQNTRDVGLQGNRSIRFNLYYIFINKTLCSTFAPSNVPRNYESTPPFFDGLPSAYLIAIDGSILVAWEFIFS